MLTYQCHPAAELFKKHALPGLLGMEKLWDEMAEFFPDLTRGELLWAESTDDVPHMLELHFMVYDMYYNDNGDLANNANGVTITTTTRASTCWHRRVNKTPVLQIKL